MEDVYQNTRSQIMTVGDWLITILITAIPIVGLVMLFVWAFGDNQNETKANWAKANLIWMVIMIVFVFIIWAVIFAIFGSQIMSGEFD
jgi:cell division protein FtsW (lipid II flippase)